MYCYAHTLVGIDKGICAKIMIKRTGIYNLKKGVFYEWKKRFGRVS